MNPIELGKFIANLRNEKKLTQEELAEKLFIDKRKISRWECGTSMPEFDMLIKLSEILDVSLYELSICKRIEKEGLTRKVINSFKSIKDYRNYNRIKRIKVMSLFILFILLMITSLFTIKHNNTVEIFELNSLDDNYYIEGDYIRAKDFNLFYIEKFNTNSSKIDFDNCEYEIYDNNTRIIHILNDNKKESNNNQQITYHEINNNQLINKNLMLQANCKNKKNVVNTHSLSIGFKKIYSNRII